MTNFKGISVSYLKSLVPKERFELSRCYHRGILNPLRLPFRHLGYFCNGPAIESCAQPTHLRAKEISEKGKDDILLFVINNVPLPVIYNSLKVTKLEIELLSV